MSGIRGEVRPHDAASGENRRRKAATGHQPLGQTPEIEAADGYQTSRHLAPTPIIAKMPVIRGVHLDQVPSGGEDVWCEKFHISVSYDFEVIKIVPWLYLPACGSD